MKNLLTFCVIAFLAAPATSIAGSYEWSHPGFIRNISFDSNGNIFIAATADEEPNRLFEHSFFVMKSSDQGKTWREVWKNNGIVLSDTPLELAIDSNDNIYLFYILQEENQKFRWILEVSRDHGATWSKHGALKVSESGLSGTILLAVTQPGTAYLVGRTVRKQEFELSWIVQKTEDYGSNWKVVDQFQFQRQATEAVAIAADQRQSVYILGNVIGRLNEWILRHSSDGGRNWKTLYPALPDVKWLDTPRSIFVSPKGTVYIGGAAAQNSDGIQADWVVAKSEDSGLTWQLSDRYRYPTAPSYAAIGRKSIAMDHKGALYAGGEAHLLNGPYSHSRLLIRKSVDEGKTWEMAQDLDISLEKNEKYGSYGGCYGLAFDPADQLFYTYGVKSIPAILPETYITKSWLRW